MILGKEHNCENTKPSTFKRIHGLISPTIKIRAPLEIYYCFLSLSQRWITLFSMIGGTIQVARHVITMAVKTRFGMTSLTNSLVLCMIIIATSARGIMLRPSSREDLQPSQTSAGTAEPKNMPVKAAKTRTPVSHNVEVKLSRCMPRPIPMKKWSKKAVYDFESCPALDR